jgi:hypothetical protein
MKNNRLTNKEINTLEKVAKRIKELASLEKCSLDDKTKKEIRPYLMWFEVEAGKIENIIENQKKVDQ